MYIKLYVCIYCKYNVYSVGSGFGVYVYISLSLLKIASFQWVVHVVHLYNSCQKKGPSTTKCNAYQNGSNVFVRWNNTKVVIDIQKVIYREKFTDMDAFAGKRWGNLRQSPPGSDLQEMLS